MRKKILLLITVLSLLSTTQIVGAVDEISGILEQDPDCKKSFSINDVTVFFGPFRYIRKTKALFDYDGDGDIETIYNELIGLVGEEVTLGGRYKSLDFFNVFTINGLFYREPGPVPWA